MKIKFDKNQKGIRRKLLGMINRAHTSHIGSCLSSIDIIDAVYSVKSKHEKFVLSNGHTGAALYIILEKYGYLKNPDLAKLNAHPDRNPKIGIDVSTGSLGQGLPIAIGMALADKNKNVYCSISDGECAEGSIWESLRIVYDLNICNLKIIVNSNGWGGYDSISEKVLIKRLKGFGFDLIIINGHKPKEIIKAFKIKNIKPIIIFAKTSSEQFSFLKGVDAHYYVMKDCDYELAMKKLK
jgi:transketolase